MCKSILL